MLRSDGKSLMHRHSSQVILNTGESTEILLAHSIARRKVVRSTSIPSKEGVVMWYKRNSTALHEARICCHPFSFIFRKSSAGLSSRRSKDGARSINNMTDS